MSVDVPAGQFKRLRLPNLPKDTAIAVIVQSTGQLALILIGERPAAQQPSSPQAPVFVGSLDRQLSFTVTIPATGNYLLVFDNRKGTEARTVKFLIRAQAAKTAPGVPPTTPSPLPPASTSKPDKF